MRLPWQLARSGFDFRLCSVLPSLNVSFLYGKPNPERAVEWDHDDAGEPELLQKR